jgi:hypothetical protein
MPPTFSYAVELMDADD